MGYRTCCIYRVRAAVPPYPYSSTYPLEQEGHETLPYIYVRVPLLVVFFWSHTAAVPPRNRKPWRGAKRTLYVLLWVWRETGPPVWLNS